MLTGRRPFEATELPVVLHKVVREDPLPIHAHEAPPELAQVIVRGLQKNPAWRYQRCEDMLADIIRFKRQFDPIKSREYPAYGPLQELPTQAPSALMTSGRLDPDDTVELGLDGRALDPAATVVMAPGSVQPMKMATENWIARLRRRLQTTGTR